MLEGLDGRPLTWLADRTQPVGANPKAWYKNVQRWVSGETVTPPVDFVSTYCAATGVTERWVLTGEKPRRPLPVGSPERALVVISDLMEAADRDPDQFQRMLDHWRQLLTRYFSPNGGGSGGGGPSPPG